MMERQFDQNGSQTPSNLPSMPHNGTWSGGRIPTIDGTD
jgi:hypothetical protein